jgi:hypothetical protein
MSSILFKNKTVTHKLSTNEITRFTLSINRRLWQQILKRVQTIRGHLITLARNALTRTCLKIIKSRKQQNQQPTNCITTSHIFYRTINTNCPIICHNLRMTHSVLFITSVVLFATPANIYICVCVLHYQSIPSIGCAPPFAPTRHQLPCPLKSIAFRPVT